MFTLQKYCNPLKINIARLLISVRNKINTHCNEEKCKNRMDNLVTLKTNYKISIKMYNNYQGLKKVLSSCLGEDDFLAGQVTSDSHLDLPRTSKF